MSLSECGSPSSRESSPSPSHAAQEIIQHLNKKSDKEHSKKSKTDDKEGPLEPFMTAARWIPLAIDPFLSLHDVILTGIKGRSGQREEMVKDEQYKIIVFEKILPLVPNFFSLLSDFQKNPKTFDRFIKQINKAYTNVRSNDANGFKNKLPIYLPPDEDSRSRFIIPDISKKMEWGWNNTITARFLCPMRLISKFDVDPEVQSGKRAIKASDYPMFLYDESKYTPGDIYSGLFQGPLLLRFYRHVFTGPSSWKTGSSGGG
ncbi:hypothetical protein JOM56_013714 [Amanita muscaria]